jgi:hypothetical protein
MDYLSDIEKYIVLLFLQNYSTLNTSLPEVSRYL